MIAMIKISTDTYKAFQRTSNPRMAEKDYIECAILEELLMTHMSANNSFLLGWLYN